MQFKDILPPFLYKLIRRWKHPYGWFGQFNSWKDAEKASGSYNSNVITQKVIEAATAVKKGKANFERDSVLFYKPDFNFSLVALLYKINNSTHGFSVVDFGGSLGSLYYQHLHLIEEMNLVNWTVVELPGIVKAGKEQFESNTLRFYDNFKSVEKIGSVNLVIFSAVLHYLENPSEIINQVLSISPNWIYIDRTPFTKEAENRIVIQKVPPEIYKATYPCWFFNQELLLKPFLSKYDVVVEFDSLDYSPYIKAEFKGFWLKRK